MEATQITDYHPCLASEAAGYVLERDLWQVMLTVAEALIPVHGRGEAHGHITARCIELTDTGFALAHFTPEEDATPEGDVWALGATVYHLALGLPLFGGRGPSAQTPETPLPIIREAWPVLSHWVRRMLAYAPSARPAMTEIADEARRQLARPAEAHAPLRQASEAASALPADSHWPETMC